MAWCRWLAIWVNPYFFRIFFHINNHPTNQSITANENKISFKNIHQMLPYSSFWYVHTYIFNWRFLISLFQIRNISHLNYIFFGKDDDKEQPIRVPAEIKCIPRAIDHFVCNTHSHFLSINESIPTYLMLERRATCTLIQYSYSHTITYVSTY